MSQYRNYCFTLNNYSREEVDRLSACTGNLIQYVCFGFECGETGTLHIQGYVELCRQSRVAALKKIPGFERAHFEARMGTQDQAINYTKKDDVGTWFEFGTKKADNAQQKQNLKQERLKEIKKKITEGATEDEIFEIDPVIAVQNYRWIEQQRNRIAPRRTEDLKVLLFIGEPGTGKTRTAYEVGRILAGDGGGVWISSGGLRWFDGYDGQRVAIFDDFRAKHVGSFDYLLRLLDRYPVKCEFKGGSVEWRPDIIFFTCPYAPETCFQKRLEHVPEDIRQLNRRITKCFEFPGGMSTEEEKENRERIISELTVQTTEAIELA